MKKLHLLLPLSMIALVLICCVACDNKPVTNITRKFLVINASSKAPLVDVYVNGTKVASSVAVDTGTTYFDITRDPNVNKDWSMKVTKAGTDSAYGSIDHDLLFNFADYNSLVIYNTTSGVAIAESNNTYGTIAQNTCLISLMNLVPDAPALDIYVNGTQIYQNIPYYSNSSPGGISGFFSAPSGASTVQVKNHDTGNVVYTLNNVNMVESGCYTFYTTGYYLSAAPTFRLHVHRMK